VETGAVEPTVGDHADARRDLDPRDVGNEQLAPVPSGHQRRGKGARKHERRAVDDPGRVGVVPLQRVDQATVDGRRVARGEALPGTEDGACAAAGTELAGGRQHRLREIRPGRGDAHAEGIEHEVLGAVADLDRDVLVAEAGDEVGELVRDILVGPGHVLSCGSAGNGANARRRARRTGGGRSRRAASA
jgi:hypothetical protein